MDLCSSEVDPAGPMNEACETEEQQEIGCEETFSDYRSNFASRQMTWKEHGKAITLD